MTEINVYGLNGEVVNVLCVDDVVEPPSKGRVSKGTKHYYKGFGVSYTQHHIAKRNFNNIDYDFINKSDIFYLGYKVQRKSFVGKFGIFQERFQPMFTDFIGTCGVKELSIIENSLFFERSSADIIKSVQHDTENNQYYFILNYKCGRKRYLDCGNPVDLKALIDYTLQSDWNFIWDKDSITDISYNGLVTDVGELFVSKQLENKLGSVYSILYSLGKQDFNKYIDLLDLYQLQHHDDKSYIFNSVDILKHNGYIIDSVYNDRNKDYQHLILNYLVTGRNCGHCSLVNVGESIKQHYIEQAQSFFGIENVVRKLS